MRTPCGAPVSHVLIQITMQAGEDLEEGEEDKEEDEETITGSAGDGLSTGLPDVDETTALLGTESSAVS